MYSAKQNILCYLKYARYSVQPLHQTLVTCNVKCNTQIYILLDKTKDSSSGINGIA